MKLYDGTGEWVRADELAVGDRVREDGEIREVVDVKQEGGLIVVVCGDGLGFECPPASRVLRKYDEKEAK